MNSCFHTSPIIPKCNIGSIQYFGLRTRETFRKQSTDTFMLPENSMAESVTSLFTIPFAWTDVAEEEPSACFTVVELEPSG